ncbi:MAG: hypothetical protein COS89_00255 [Deltaproteobacteria bacterium CG07_land_8_20_14_0_80_38_7]|nr:MAG: hypothetical protein COS89_00255 [Deltaproteobacteria bacterium CG07_land_8_20_14_0_80_38_7]
MTDEITDINGDKRNPDGTFAEGNKGGPGRPVFSLISMLKAELQKCPEGQDKRTYADMLIQRIMKKAISDGDDQQIKNILQYVEGMPRQGIDMKHQGKITLEEFLNESETRDNQE